MDNSDLIGLLDSFKSGLLSKATNGDMDDNEYKRY